MPDRITVNMLERRVSFINELLDRSDEPYSKDSDGNYHPNAGNYHLSGAYGGYALHEMSHIPGCTGVSDVFSCGHVSKRELYNRINAFIDGILAA